MSSEKVTLAQAAGRISVHINTIKTWRRSGHLKTAELIIEHGVEVWHVDLDEAIQVAQSKRNKRVDSSLNNGVYPAGYPDAEPPKQESTPAPGQTLTINPVQEQTIAFFRDTVVAPLKDLIKEQGAEIAPLTAQNALLKDELDRLKAAQTAPQPPPAPEVAQPVEIYPSGRTAKGRPGAAKERVLG